MNRIEIRRVLVDSLRNNVFFPSETQSHVMILVCLLNTLLLYETILKLLEKQAEGMAF